MASGNFSQTETVREAKGKYEKAKEMPRIMPKLNWQNVGAG